MIRLVLTAALNATALVMLSVAPAGGEGVTAPDGNFNPAARLDTSQVVAGAPDLTEK